MIKIKEHYINSINICNDLSELNILKDKINADFFLNNMITDEEYKILTQLLEKKDFDLFFNL